MAFALSLVFFFFNDTATTEIYTLSLHDALPISTWPTACGGPRPRGSRSGPHLPRRSEEHTSELQSLTNLVCRLLLEKKNNKLTSRRVPASGEETQRTHHPRGAGEDVRGFGGSVSRSRVASFEPTMNAFFFKRPRAHQNFTPCQTSPFSI